LDRFNLPAQSELAQIRDKILEPFIGATRVAVSEMAGTEVVVRSVSHSTMRHALGDISAVVAIKSKAEELLVLSFPHQTAAALASRMLSGVSQEVDDNLIRDCVAEIANVVAGQSKALMAGATHQYAFSMPQVVGKSAEFRPQPGLHCLVVNLGTDHGEFAIQVFLKL
jgi:CheY-specific phosphatase CheX